MSTHFAPAFLSALLKHRSVEIRYRFARIELTDVCINTSDVTRKNLNETR